MAKSKKTVKKKKNVQPVEEKPPVRIKKEQSYRSFRLQKRIKHQRPKMLSSFGLFKQALSLLWRNKRRVFFVTLIYGVLMALLVLSARTSLKVGDVKNSLQQVISGSWNGLAASAIVVGFMLGSSATTSQGELSGLYQSILLLIGSLAFIWTFRHAFAGQLQKYKARDAFYKGMEPLIPLICVILFIILQAVPAWVGLSFYTIASNTGLIVNIAERAAMILFASGMTLFTLYMLTSSIFGIYIVTLPGMTPVKALRSARKLVLYRRWTVMRRILLLPVFIVVCSLLLMVPFVLWLPKVAEPLFYAYSILLLPITHAYMYSLYRELLREK